MLDRETLKKYPLIPGPRLSKKYEEQFELYWKMPEEELISEIAKIETNQRERKWEEKVLDDLVDRMSPFNCVMNKPYGAVKAWPVSPKNSILPVVLYRFDIPYVKTLFGNTYLTHTEKRKKNIMYTVLYARYQGLQDMPEIQNIPFLNDEELPIVKWHSTIKHKYKQQTK